jgi:endo-1,4-beta-xylanase
MRCRESNLRLRFFAARCLALAAVTALGCSSGDKSTLTEPPAPSSTIGALRSAASARGFLVGAEVQVAPLTASGPYPDTVAAEYNLLTPGNAMKFSVIHPAAGKYDFTGGDAVVSFASANGMKVRGHVLVWHNQLPDWISNQLTASDYSNCGGISAATRQSLSSALRDHIATVVGHYKGELSSWDVVSEAFDDGGKPARRNTVWQCALGSSYIDSAFVWARRADPNVKLFYIDYGAEGSGAKSDSVFNLVSRLRGKGIPIDGVGLEMHGALQTTLARDFLGPTTTSVAQNMDRLAALGVDVQITEMDIKLLNPSPSMWQAQGQIFASMLGVCLARVKCTAFVTWGFTDLWTWDNPGRPTEAGWTQPLPFDVNYAHKPAFDSLLATMKGGR